LKLRTYGSAFESDISTLHLLRRVAAAGSVAEFIMSASGYRLTAGTTALATAIATDANADIRYSTAVRSLVQDEHGVAAHTPAGVFRGRLAVIAVPLNVLKHIDFVPALCEGKRRLSAEEKYDEGFVLHDVWQDVQAHIAPVMPEGYGGSSNVEELQSQTRIRAEHAITVVDDTFRLLADDLLNGTRWLDVRKAQNPSRNFGSAPTRAWEAFRKVTPVQGSKEIRSGVVAYEFLKANPASQFAPPAENEPAPARKSE
jgi:hypothetical protein